MSTFNKIRAAAAAFFCLIYAATPALADDSEIYLGGASGTSGNPNVLMLLDTSGSMQWNVFDNNTATTESNARYYQLKKAVEKILSTLPGNIRVGIARYNTDTNGGRIIYPLTALDSPAGSNSDGSQTHKFSIATGSTDDVQQTGAAGSTLVTGGKTLTIGGTTLPSITMSAVSDSSIECSAQTATAGSTYTPSLYVSATSPSTSAPRGLYLNNHPVPNTSNSTYCQSNVGVRFLNSTTGIPVGSTIASARLVLTHAGSPGAAPSTGTNWGPDNDNAMSLRVYIQNSATTKTFATASPDRVNDRTYDSSSTSVSLAAEEFSADGEQLAIDVTSLVQARVSGTWTRDANSSLTFKIAGQSGDGTYSTRSNRNNPEIRRIYGFQDAAYAPRLEVTYIPASGSDNQVGLRFTGFDVPQGATINSAYIEMTAAAASTASPAPSFQVASDKLDSTYINSLPFDSTNHLGSARWESFKTATLSSNTWAAGQTITVDVKDLVKAHTDSSLYCGANAVTGNSAIGFVFKALTGSGVRTAYSLEGGYTPRLVVNYTVDTSKSSCVQIRRAHSPNSSSSDAVQVGTGNNSLTDSKISLINGVVGSTACTSNCAAIRFGSVQVPRNAVIVSAILTLYGSNSTPKPITLKSIDTNDQAEFTTTTKISSFLLNSGSVSWSPSTWSSTSSFDSPNLASIIQPVVNRSGWAKGNSLGLVLAGTSSTGPQFYAYDNGTSSKLPVLTIIYKSTDANDGVSTARQVLIDTVNGLTFSGGTPLNETYYETALYMLGETARYGRAYTPLYSSSYQQYSDSAPAMNSSNLYVAPTNEASCQTNAVIMLTDGLPSSDFDAVNKGPACAAPLNVGTVGGNNNTADSFACMQATANYLAKTGRGDNKIKTYTIGFGPVSNITMASEGLAAVAKSGEGEYFPATDSDSLAASFQSIFARVADSNGTMAAPGVAVSQLNRSEHLDQLYYGVFKPKTQRRWPGNLKRYQLGSSNEILGRNGNSAIDSKTKYFSTSAVSWWGSPVTRVDGNEAADGGAAERQDSALKVYTDTGAAGALVLLDPANPPAGLGGNTTDGINNTKWIMGYDVDNENGQGPSGFRQAMGSPIHPQPTLVSYGSGNEDFAVFVSTNDGLLHSVNNSDGTHNWAWLPSALQGQVADLRANAAMPAGGMPIYGLDGSWSLVTLTSGTRVLVGGMRQGGNNYYALTLPATKAGVPALRWMKTSAQLDGAKTWSQPTFGRVRVKSGSSSSIKDIVVVGGGLDFGVYESGASAISSGADAGNAVFIFDADSGTQLAAISTADMKYSVPGTPRLVDKDGDGLADHIYFGDTGGQIFRIDIDNSSSASTLVKGTALLAKLGISSGTGKLNDRRFYETPAVSYVKGSDGVIYAAVAIGSGDRNFPKSNKDTNDRFYVIKDYDAAKFGVATTSKNYTNANLDDLTNNANVGSTSAGWYINMTASGEKVLSSPFIFSRSVTGSDGSTSLVYEVYFNSFRPDTGTSSSSCTPVAGATYAYTANLFNAAPPSGTSSGGTVNASDRSSTDAATNGLSGSDVGLVRPKCSNSTCTGAGDDPNKKELVRLTGTKAADAGDLPPGFNQIQRTRWFDNPNATH